MLPTNFEFFAWPGFCIAFGVMLLSTLLMNIQGQYFYTIDPVLRQFSILDLEFPSSSSDFADTIVGIFRHPQSAGIIRAIKKQLFIDYLLFIPATYIGIFLLCLKTAKKFANVAFAEKTFVILAYAQLLCFLLDYIENTYFWIQLKATIVEPNKFAFNSLRGLEILKWGFALIGSVASLSSMAYFWVSGRYMITSLYFVKIFFAELLLFIFIQSLCNFYKHISSIKYY